MGSDDGLLKPFSIYRYLQKWMNSHSNNKKRFLICIVSVFVISCFLYSNWLIITHVTRPLWGITNAPLNAKVFIPNYGYLEGNDGLKRTCTAYGVAPRKTGIRIFDTFLFHHELDWLEIRLNELYDVVDAFVLVESSRTFTNHAKPLVFDANKALFQKFNDKIIHAIVHDDEVIDAKNSQVLRENKLRWKVREVLKERAKIQEGELVLISDVDEIPRKSVVQAMKVCDFHSVHENPIHLELQRFLYSFEFPRGIHAIESKLITQGFTNNAAIWSYNATASGQMDHTIKSRTLFADAGWHCTFCFKHIEEIVASVISYSDANSAITDPVQLQKRVCEGEDLHNRYPQEVRTFREVFESLGQASSRKSIVGLPEYVVQNHEKFSYLLPGYCMREKMSFASMRSIIGSNQRM